MGLRVSLTTLIADTNIHLPLNVDNMKKKFKREQYIGGSKIYVGEHLVPVKIYRSVNGNLRIAVELDEKQAPDGTCSEMYNDELTIYPHIP